MERERRKRRKREGRMKRSKEGKRAGRKERREGGRKEERGREGGRQKVQRWTANCNHHFMVYRNVKILHISNIHIFKGTA